MTAIFLPMGDCAEYIARLTKCLTTALWLVNIKSTNLQNTLQSNGDVIAYADVQLFHHYISTALDYGVLQHNEWNAEQGFYGLTIIVRAH